MSDSQNSWDAGTLWDNLQLLIVEARTALDGLPKWEKPFLIFWLLGPFFLLIERSPADAWLSILALAFAVRSLCRLMGRGWDGWVRAAFIFWFVCFISASLSIALPMRWVRLCLGSDFPYLLWPRPLAWSRSTASLRDAYLNRYWYDARDWHFNSGNVD